MEVTDIDKDIFSKVKESCIQLSQIAFLPAEVVAMTTTKTTGQSKKLTDALQKLYTNLDGSISQHCQEQATSRLMLNRKLADYIFVPISSLLKQDITLTDKQVELIFKLINRLITHCWYYPMNNSALLFSQLFPLFLYLLDESKSHIVLSVESKIAGVECLYSLLESIVMMQGPTGSFFEKSENLPILGQMITLILDLAMTQNSIVLQSKCLELLSLLYMRILNDGEKLSHILPGNVSVLTKLIAQKHGISTHYTILVKIVNLLSFLICKVFKDKELGIINRKLQITDIDQLVEFASDKAMMSNNNNIGSSNIDDESNVIVIPVTNDKQHRTTSWLKATSSQIKLAIPIIMSLRDHKKYEVRKSILQMCQSLIQDCSTSLANCLPLIVDSLSFLHNDPMLQLEINQWVNNEPLLKQVIRSKLENKIQLLPSVLSSSNQDKIVNDLKSLSFYLFNSKEDNTFLIEDCIATIHNSVYRYISAEITTKRFKNKNIQVLAMSDDGVTNELMTLQKNYTTLDTTTDDDIKLFDKFYDLEVERELSNILQRLGQFAKWFIAASKYLLSNGDDTPLCRAISLWMINNLVTGLQREPTTTGSTDVIDEFLTLDDDHQTTNVTKKDDDIKYEVENTIYDVMTIANEILQETSTLNPDLINSMIQSISLDSIGLSSTVLGKDLFQIELVDYLYPVIDSLASSNDQIRKHAQRASLVISQVCYEGSLHDLIYENRDYLIDSLSLKLTSDFISPRTSAVLLVLVKIGGMDLIRQLNDVIHTMFTLLDLYHGYDSLSEGFFIVFNSVIDQVYMTYLSNYDFTLQKSNVENYNKPWMMTELQQVFDLIDDNKRDLEINLDGEDIPLVKHPNVPFGQVPDSDDDDDSDDDSDDEMALMKEIDNYQVEKSKDDKAKKWDSPIPNDLYFIIQQMLSYGDRLILSTDSIRLQSRILEVFIKVFPILSTSQLNLFPILADIWPLVLNLITDDDVRILGNAIRVVHIMLDFGGDFMSKKFTELWHTLINDCKIFNECFQILQQQVGQNDELQLAQRVNNGVYGNVNFKAYRLINECLIFGLNKLGTTIPNNNKLVIEIINHTILLFPDEDEYGCFADIAWLVRYERFQKHRDVQLQKPDNVTLHDGEVFEFYNYGN